MKVLARSKVTIPITDRHWPPSLRHFWNYGQTLYTTSKVKRHFQFQSCLEFTTAGKQTFSVMLGIQYLQAEDVISDTSFKKIGERAPNRF